MKKTLLILSLMLGFIMMALAQNVTVIQPDSVYMYYNDPSWSWSPVDDKTRTIVFAYDSMGLLTQHHDRCGSGQDGNTTQANYVYDEHHNCISAHITTDYDIAGRIRDIIFNYQDNLLINEQETNLLVCPPQYGGGTTYINTDYSYDDEGRIVETLKMYSGYNSMSMCNTKTSYEYRDHQVSETFEAFHPSGEWRVMSRATKTYSDNGLPIQSLRELANDSTRLTIYHYDEQERITGSTTQKMMNGEVVNEFRTVYDLDDNGMPTHIRFEDWDGQRWVPGSSKFFLVQFKYGSTIYQYYFNDITLFTEDFLNSQETLISDRGIASMELFYTNTTHPSYDISEKPFTNDIDIHPNPTSGTIFIGGEDLQQAEVYNILGQFILSEQNQSQSITLNLSGQPAGIYLVKITDKKGQKCVKKVVKE